MNLKEIAKAANVSPSTVSMVLNNRRGVGIKTRERIQAMLNENGYDVVGRQRDAAGSIRFLKFSHHSYLVNGNAGFVSSIIDAVEAASRQLGYNLVMSVFDKDSLNETVNMVRNEPLNGSILLATELEAEDIAYFNKLPAPLVVVDNCMDGLSFNCVDMNNVEATAEAVEHLLSLGHRKIGYLYNKFPSSNCRARFMAYQAILKEKSISLDQDMIFHLHPTMAGAYSDMLALLQQGVELPPALLATNDSIALGAIKAFREFGLQVPNDVSVIGFDDTPFSAIAEPPLTTMRVSCQEIGNWAVRLLHDRIEHPDAPVAKILIGAQLVVRESTCQYHAK